MTPEMREQRLGLLTASKAGVIMGDWKRGRETLDRYIRTLAFERVYGDTGEQDYKSAAMDRGNELEPRALEWYAFEKDAVLSPGGICYVHRMFPFVGASPDALLKDRVIEAKCLLHSAWMDSFLSQEIPSTYRWQCRWQQWVLGLDQVDFVVWHPVAGGFVINRRVTADEVEQMTERAFLVDEDVKAAVERLRNRKEAA